MQSLLDPTGGMIDRLVRYDSLADEPPVVIVSAVYARLSKEPTAENFHIRKNRWDAGSGTGILAAESIVPALAEALERRAACCLHPEYLMVASANELGDYALDLHSIPRCSPGEMQNPNCRLVQPVFDLPMRWIEGTSLLTGRKVALPHSMVYLRCGVLAPHERLQVPISTGLAAHTDMATALSSALLEVVERDALSVMWLQQIPGTPLDPFAFDDGDFDWMKQRSSRLRYDYWNIETDLPIPVICCLRRAPDDSVAHTLLTCAADFDAKTAIAKVSRDMSARAIGFRQPRPVPEKLEDFDQIHHGATYMAARERSHAFDFMFQPAHAPAYLSNRRAAEDDLHELIRILKQRAFDAYAVDLTTPESASVGVHVVRVLVPSLQPLPLLYAARYLAHSRLYQVPRSLGIKVRSEPELNPWPVPFA